ncbi:MAG: AAA family ATPase [Smithellaceae bacterium]
MNSKSKPLIVSITSGKGGVGKTFITTNLAAVLARQGKKVLVADCDLGLANIDVMLGINPALNLKDVVFGNKHLRDVIVPTKGGFDLIPASSGVREMAQLLYEKIQNIKDMLLEIEGYDLILLDTGAGIAEVVLQFNLLARPECCRDQQGVDQSHRCLRHGQGHVPGFRPADLSVLLPIIFRMKKDGAGIFKNIDTISRALFRLPSQLSGIMSCRTMPSPNR